MADRKTYDGASQDVPFKDMGGAEGYGNNIARHVKTLYDASVLPLSAASGLDALSATVDPVLDGALRDGMKFTLTAPSTNTGAMTLAIGGGAAVPLLQADGVTIPAGMVTAGLRMMVEFIGGNFRILSEMGANGQGGSAARYYWRFAASGTLNLSDAKALLSPDAMVIVEAWGGGAGGQRGGGGGYNRGYFRLGSLPSSIGISIAAGGNAGQHGGNTTFGTLLTAYGGHANGRGGGVFGAGTSKRAGTEADAMWSWEGGNGPSDQERGGSSIYGGGAGASLRGQAGRSLYGGDGGADFEAGKAPGGGGGQNAPGARGEVRVWI